jgi:glycosyltransferase involved in cell wall biosynthesis
LLFVGRPSKSKGLFDLLDALVILKEYNWELGIVGEYKKFETELNRYSEKFGGCRIKLFGSVPNPEVAVLMNKHHIVVVPSHYDNFANVSLEAMACGRVVIASFTGGLKERIKNMQTGLHFKPKDVNDLAQKIELVFRNPSLINTIGQNAKREARQYSWKKICIKTEKLFQKYLQTAELRRF